MAETTAIKYRAFLSYSHRDKVWGEWLHRTLEAYRIDKDLTGRETDCGLVPKTLRPIFRDREDFSAGHSLTEKTLAALEASQFLIVICSPDAAASRYVNDEVRRFKALGRASRVIPVIVAGEPGDPTTECFPPALRFKVGPDGAVSSEREEPLAADARSQGDGKEIAKQKIVAALLGLGLDEIVRRAERVRRRRTRMWAALVGMFLLLSITATGTAVYAWHQLKTNEGLLDATLKRATEIVRAAVDNAQKYHVPRAATLEFLRGAEGLFDDMARLGTATPELNFRKALMQIEFARSYSGLGDSGAAQSRATSAIQLLEEFAKRQPQSFEVLLALADARMQLGHALDIQGQLDAAIAQFEVSLLLGRRYLETDRSSTVALSIISLSNERIGDILRKQGRFAQAASFYRANFQVAERLTVRLPEAVEKLSMVIVELGDRDAGLTQMRKALASLGTRLPENRDYFLPIVSSLRQTIGGLLLAQGELSGALTEFESAHAIVAQLADRDRSDKNLQSKLATSRALIEEVSVARGNGRAVLESYKARLPAMERLALSDARNVYWQVGLALAHELIADAQMTEGESDKALSSYRASHRIWERVAAMSPHNVDWSLSLLWSHSRLALLGDEPTERLGLIVTTLRSLKEQNRITPSLQPWLPVAEEALAAVQPTNELWQADLVSVLWRATPLTRNPVRQCALLVAMLRKLQQEKRLRPEQVDWVSRTEAQLATMRRQ